MADVSVTPAAIDSCLTQRTPVSLPAWKELRVPSSSTYTSLTSITPILEPFLGRAITREGTLASDTQITDILDMSGSGVCRVETTRGTLLAYCKVTHLIDPARTLQNYYADAEKGVKRRLAKIENPMNQAYVDGLANYLVGQLRERGISPHFCISYGSYKAVASTYRYNITEDYESYRKYKAFWERQRQGLFKLHTYGAEDLSTPASSLRSSPFTCGSIDSDKSHETLDYEATAADSREVELESVDSFPSNGSGSQASSDSEKDESESDDEDESEDEIFADFKDYPVLLIFQERLEGVMDDLLEDEEAVGAEMGTEEWEERWTAWIFQVIAALCCAQGVLGFTHNDLHTNNILWSSTTEKYICYGARDGTVWRVPTYGRIFRIIDFGRSIFRVGDRWFVSDDYARGGDAAGQYSLSALKPNPSFDLCRLAVSLIDMVFPDPPVERLDGDVLSCEGSWTVHETESPLWNMLWTWLLDEDGCNVLRDEDGTERFPDFDLYQKISATVFGAKPQEQIRRTLFNKYKVSRDGVKTMYPLFC